jgi:hypothetical protein
MVSGPNVPVIHSPGSSTTFISNLVAGSYLFQLMATDTAGLTGVDTTRATVLPSLTQTITLQPANSNTEILLGLHNGIPITNSSGTPELVGAAWTNGGLPYLLRSLLQFDLSQIPSTATISSARLSLYSNPTPINGNQVNANFGTNNAFYIRRVTGTWVPGVVNFNTVPSVSTIDQVLVPHTSASSLDVTDIDVKGMISTMVSSGNYGFLLQLQAETIYTLRNFASSRSTDATKRPKLVITYTP